MATQIKLKVGKTESKRKQDRWGTYKRSIGARSRSRCCRRKTISTVECLCVCVCVCACVILASFILHANRSSGVPHHTVICTLSLSTVSYCHLYAVPLYRIILSSVRCPALPYQNTLSHKRYDLQEKALLNTKCFTWFSLQICLTQFSLQ